MKDYSISDMAKSIMVIQIKTKGGLKWKDI